METSAKIATALCGKEISTQDFFKCMLALKLGRLAHFPKYDTIVDLIGYAGGWWNYLQERGMDEFSKELFNESFIKEQEQLKNEELKRIYEEYKRYEQILVTNKVI